MATVVNNDDFRTKIAGEDLSSSKYMFVTLESDDTVDLCDAITDRPFGVLQNSPVAGESAVVKVSGDTKVIAAGALTVGLYVATTAAGLAQTATNAQFARGSVVSPAGAANDIAVIQLFLDASNS